MVVSTLNVDILLDVENSVFSAILLGSRQLHL